MEYKFRAWHREQKRMIQPVIGLSLEADNSYIEWYETMHDALSGNRSQCFFDKVELMQYVGRGDANNDDICQHDLWEYGGVKYTVEWDDEDCGFYFRHPDKRASADDHIGLAESWRGVVIGNKWEGTTND